ncbi:1,4-dihydroxy-2-naphthoate prenyltransferase [Ectothiorhodosinus mongolicus]|uniref:1,4-dihydroxy-2-naphthoate prenyltransferase n=2 Tax=Ectothiorhodosinus mongolicus TaxID=233100 RepID=A0A1R3VZY6_9GAMM|nr:1,4-dihydroxy-2-naphthoate prenyltransferase [Ectothiorhodosinus mongolicus]
MAAYDFLRAMRPFSFVVALSACGLGTLLAYQQGYGSITLALLIVLAGMLLQAAVNLINDHADLPLLQAELQRADSGSAALLTQAITAIHRNYRVGLIFLGIALLIGLGLVLHRGWPLLLLISIGLPGAYFYSAEPIHYKRRGLGVFMVFWLMGILLIGGSAMAMGAPLSLQVLLMSVPFSLFTALVLLGNEIRDYDKDRANELRTLTVRIGVPAARVFFALGLVGSYLMCLFLWRAELLPIFWPLILSLPFAITPLRAVVTRSVQAQALPQQTGRLFAVFALLYLVSCLPLL